MKFLFFLLACLCCLGTKARAEENAFPLRPDLKNQGAVFSGKYSSLTSKAAVQDLTGLTFEGWVKIDKNTQNTLLFGIDQNFQLTWRGKKLTLNLNKKKISAPFENDGKWRHIAATLDEENQVSLIVDGQILDSTRLNRPTKIQGKIRLGAGLYGMMDEVRLWNKALPPEQLWKTVISVSHPAYTKLIGYWRLDGNLNDCRFTDKVDSPYIILPLQGSPKYQKADNDVRYGMVTGYLRDGHLSQVTRSMLLCANDIIFFPGDISISSDGGCNIKDESKFKEKLDLLRDKIGNVDRLSLRLGFHGGNFRDWMASSEGCEKFAKESTALLKKYNLDGMDLDFEWPLQNEKAIWDGYAETVVAIRKNAPNTILSVSLGGWACALPQTGRDVVDYFTFQTYGARSFRFTFQKFKDDSNTFKRFKYPRERSLLGHPFYGTCDKGAHYTRHYRNIIGQKPDIPMDADTFGFQFGKENFTIYFNGVETIRQKTRWALEENCLGIMYWDLAGDVEPENKHSLIRAVNEFYGSLAVPKVSSPKAKYK